MLPLHELVSFKMRGTKEAAMYSCPSCRQTPAQVKSLICMVSKLTELLQTVCESNQELTSNLSKLEFKVTELTDKNATISQQMAAIQQSINTKRQGLREYQNKKQTVVIGSSIVKHMDEKKMSNTTVMCKPGAKVKDIEDKVKSLPNMHKFDRLVLVAGGNDISENDDLHEIKQKYKTTVEEAKKQCSEVVVAAVPPRIKAADFLRKAEQLNAELQIIAAEGECQYVDHSAAFYPTGGQVNDGYFDSDETHPNLRGTNRMGQALGLQSKDTDRYDIASRNAAKKHPTQDQDRKTATTPSVWQQQRWQRKPQPRGYESSNTTWQRKPQPQASSRWQRKPQPRGYDSLNTTYRHTRNNSTQYSGQKNTDKSRECCEFCAEPNHTTRSCGFKDYVQCHTCGHYGHKQKYCYDFCENGNQYY